ncbi:MAG: hypothetical protein ACP5N3_02160 [Candidatus Nanoarchaeia archaeon]
MIYLNDVIKNHIEPLFRKQDSAYYFGTINTICPESNEDEITVKLISDNEHNKYIPSGYFTLRRENKPYDLSFSTESGFLYFNIFPDKLEITTKPAQITKEVPLHPQAITKGDWITPSNIKIILEGDYKTHRTLMEKTYTDFKNNKKAELWLPTFFQQTTSL